jgi:spermidine synthase
MALTSAVVSPGTGPLGRLALLALFAASGGAALVYQVLWFKQLGMVFGGTAPAAAATLACFFLGLALGSWRLGRWAQEVPRPMRAYALLEVALLATAALFLLWLPLYRWIAVAALGHLLDAPAAALALRMLLAAIAIIPTAFCMGGTFPLMIRLFIAERRDLARGGTLVYAVNTVGAATGAVAAGFFLPPALGYTRSYAVGLALTGLVAVVAAVLSRDEVPSAGVPEPAGDEGAGEAAPWRVIAVASGVVTLGAEVLWTRMFSQVLHNSVYSFAIILVTFLFGLSVGSIVAHTLVRSTRRPATTLALLLGMSALGLAATPWIFWATTGGLDYRLAVSGRGPWMLALSLLLPAVALGTVFPFVLRLLETSRGGVCSDVGRLGAINTLGGAAGSLAAGFVLLPAMGLWGAILALAMVQVAAVLALAPFVPRPGLARAAVAAGLVGLVVAGASVPASVFLAPGTSLVALRESGAGLVAVTERNGQLRLRLNNTYILGGTASAAAERRQSHLPLLLHPAPSSVFYLGMGTGITAGASLNHPVERVVVCELVPEVIRLAREHFAPHANGLFDDPRVRLVADDGRAYLAATRETFDVVISDLFVPWKAGAGSLYTAEHYRAGLRRLNPGGLYAQWIPLYQVSRREYDVIAATMASVFPEVTVWRGDFFDRRPIVLLLGARDPGTLDADAAAARATALLERLDPDCTPQYGAVPLQYWIGTVDRATAGEAGINRDDHPLVEFLAPVTHLRQQATGGADWFVAEAFLEYSRSRTEAALATPLRGPWITPLGEDQRALVRDGLDFYAAVVARGSRAVSLDEDPPRTVRDPIGCRGW